MSVTLNGKAAHFRALHNGPSAFVIPNPWDAGSARILAGLGFQASATSSAAAASAIGRRDHGLTQSEALADAKSEAAPRPLYSVADLQREPQSAASELAPVFSGSGANRESLRLRKTITLAEWL